MKSVSKSEIADYLHCINRHCRELLADAHNDSLPKEQRDAADARCSELYKLKKQVLFKMVAEGFATVRKPLHRIGRLNYYCIRLNRENTFHIRRDSRVRKALKGCEQQALSKKLAAGIE